MNELNAQGVKVPGEISVVTFDHVEECRFASPSLTSVGSDKSEVAGSALAMLVERIAGLDTGPRDQQLKHRLVVRASTSGST